MFRDDMFTEACMIVLEVVAPDTGVDILAGADPNMWVVMMIALEVIPMLRSPA